MSRIGKRPIELASGVSASIAGNVVTVKGPKGELSYTWNEGVSITEEDGKLVVARESDGRIERSLQGLTRSLVANMVTGVSQGYKRELIVNGVGYRIEQQGNTLVFHVGFSNPVEYKLPDGISAKVDTKNNRIALEGIDKQVIGQAAADIRGIRPTEPYKGKGIQYADEVIRRKVGKTTA